MDERVVLRTTYPLPPCKSQLKTATSWKSCLDASERDGDRFSEKLWPCRDTRAIFQFVRKVSAAGNKLGKFRHGRGW